MISTGIVRHIDALGRVVLPKELRRTFGISAETPLEILTEGDAILLRKYRPAPAGARGGAGGRGSGQLHGMFGAPAGRPALTHKSHNPRRPGGGGGGWLCCAAIIPDAAGRAWIPRHS
mgnify:CR=1 FL=1